MLKRVAQGIVSIVLIAALFYFGLIDLKTLRAAASAPGALGTAITLSFFANVIAGWRWHILLRSQGLVLAPSDTMSISLVAAFFGTFFPGGTGGDVIRGIYVVRATQNRRVAAVFSILIDHLVGLLGFTLMGAAALLFKSTATVFDLPLLGLAAASVIGVVILFGYGHRISGWIGRGSAIGSKIGGKIDQLPSALESYSRSRGAVVQSVLLSVVIAALQTGSIALLASAMGFDRLSLGDYGIAYVYATIAGLLPITPAGIGVGEAGFVAVCIQIDPGGSYATVFVLFRIVAIIASLPGLLLYWLYPQRISFQE